MRLEIRANRKEEITNEIDYDSILSSGLLDPGSAGKLNGKVGCAVKSYLRGSICFFHRSRI